MIESPITRIRLPSVIHAERLGRCAVGLDGGGIITTASRSGGTVSGSAPTPAMVGSGATPSNDSAPSVPPLTPHAVSPIDSAPSATIAVRPSMSPIESVSTRPECVA